MTVTREDLERYIKRLQAEVQDPTAGIYGPQSQSWLISKEVILFLGGGRATLLQTAHPFVAHGIDQHSATKHDPLGRFQRTFENVFAMVFGDLDNAVRSARRVYNIHTRVHGQIEQDLGRFAKGSPYLANDEEALFWVHATLIETAVQVYELIVRPLSAGEKERYYQETRRFAYLFGIPDRVIPKDWEAFAAYNREMWDSSTLAVGSAALELRHFLFASPKPGYATLFRWLETISAGLMPERLRDAYQLPWTQADQRVFRGSVSALRVSYKRLPRRLRYQPAYVQARRRLAGVTGPDRIGQLLEHAMLFGLDKGTKIPRGKKRGKAAA